MTNVTFNREVPAITEVITEVITKVPAKPATITLELTVPQAQVVHALLGVCTSTTVPRGYDTPYYALDKALLANGVKRYNVPDKALDPAHGRIHLSLHPVQVRS